MAEILLSLTIIGVVAAITLPSLTGNINERTWNTQRKALYARMSQAISLMPALNGYGILEEDASGNIEDTAAETFLTNGLAKVIKINNICDSEHLADCGIPNKVTPYSGSVISPFPRTLFEMNSMFNGSYSTTTSSGDPLIYSYSQLNTKAAAFETANGESIAVFYNPRCVGDFSESGWYYTQPKMCANFIYDLNGTKGPNSMGKDIGFISVLYPTNSVVVAPLPYPDHEPQQSSRDTVSGLCRARDSEARVPNIDELTAMFYNRKLLDSTESLRGGYWSSTVSNSGMSTGWITHFGAGFRYKPDSSTVYWVHCVKR